MGMKRWGLLGVGAIATIAVTVAAMTWSIVVVGLLGGVLLLVLAARKPTIVAPALVVVAIPFMRPNVQGETYSIAATGLVVLAGVIAFLADRGRSSIPKPYVLVIILTAALYLWLLLNSSIFAGSARIGSLVQGGAIALLTLISIGMVIADPRRRRYVVRGFVWLVLALSASFVVTFAIWLVAGFGTGAITPFTTYIGAQGDATLYFPFTPSFGFQTVGGITFPRLVGLGREPGWMSLYCGMALLLWGRVGRPRLLGQLVLLAGLLGAFSTAGFGAFVVALVIAWILKKPRTKDFGLQFIALGFKLVVLAGALWTAIYAPVFGFASKGTLNAVSLAERSQATAAGIDAINVSPLGGIYAGSQESINLIAGIAPFGLPFALIALGILLLPMIGHPAKRLALAPILLLMVTLVSSQPLPDSVFIFVLIGLVYAVTLPVAPLTTEDEPVKEFAGSSSVARLRG